MNSSTQRTYEERILGVLVHIQQHLDDELSLDALARLAHFSPFHFHRVFRGMVGEPLKEHIRRLRLERAASRLLFSEDQVIQIALDAGYDSHEAFTRAFTEMFSMPPSTYRKARRRQQAAASPASVPRLRSQWKGEKPMDVRIEKLEPTRVAFMRHVGPYQQVGATWQQFMAWCGPRGLCGPAMKCFGLCHDDPEVTPPEKIRYDACVPVDAKFQPQGDVGVQTIAGGDYAVTTHHGPYERLAETYARLCGEWLPASGREPRAAPSFEVYRNSPMNTPPQDLLTDVYVPLADR